MVTSKNVTLSESLDFAMRYVHAQWNPYFSHILVIKKLLPKDGYKNDSVLEKGLIFGLNYQQVQKFRVREIRILL